MKNDMGWQLLIDKNTIRL